MLGCRFAGDLDQVSTKNALDVKHKEWPARYVGSQIETRAELAPLICRFSPME